MCCWRRRVCFVTNKLAASLLCLMGLLPVTAAADSCEGRNLTDNPASDRSPVFSPDGARVLFASDRDGNWNLFLFDLSNDQTTRITDWPGNERRAAWANDSRRVVLESENDGAKELLVLNVETGETHAPSVPGLDVSGPDWSPGGAVIAFSGEYTRDAEPSVVLLELNHWRVRPLGPGHLPRFDPAGDTLVYFASPGEDDDLFLWPLPDGPAVQLTTGPGDDFAPTWSADGQRVLFVSNRDAPGMAQLTLVDRHGRGRMQVCEDSGRATEPDWHGDQIVWVSNRNGNDEIYLAPAPR